MQMVVMTGFRNSLIAFVVGIAVGIALCYLSFSRTVDGVSTHITVERNSNEITSAPVTNIKQSNKHVDIVTKLETPHYGTISVNQTISRESLQYLHQIGLGGGVLLNTKTPYVKLEYSYKNIGFELLGGYSLAIYDFEIGVGAKYIWKF